MDKDKKIKIAFAFTAFLLMSVAFSLSFQEKGIVSFVSTSIQSANTQGGIKYPKISDSAKAYYQNEMDYGKASQKSGLSPSQLKNLVSKVVGGGLGPCLGSSGGITVSGSCTPPGPGECSGDPKKPGRDLCPCQVSGVKGGSITSVCMGGCCVLVSASGSSGAFGSFSPSQLMQLGLKGLGMLMNSGGGGGSGSSYSPYQYSYNDSLGTANLMNDNFLDETSVVSDFDTYDYSSVLVGDESETTDNNNTVAQKVFKSNDSSIETYMEKQNDAKLIVNKVDLKSEAERLNDVNDAYVFDNTSPASDSGQQDANGAEIEFQVVKKETNHDPRLDKLRDLETSKVRNSVLTKKESRYDLDVPKLPQKSWWEKIIDFLLSPFN